jgi:hypothetical protein
MSDVQLVRFSRDGDHFHYYWAARQCLKLLDATTDLVAVTVEGPSSKESDDEVIEPGAELIDVGLYFGNEDLVKARSARYVQLKHSTTNAVTPWTGSGLKKTIEGFSERCRELFCRLSVDELKSKVSFKFITNRPIAADVLETLEDLAGASAPRHSDVASLLTKYCVLTGDQLGTFFQLFSVEGGEPGLWDQRNLLSIDTSVFLSDPDVDAATQLVHLVSRRALSEAESDPAIRKADVLRAFRVDQDQLFPAACQLAVPNFELAREQDAPILQAVLAATSPVVIHADGGVGKSMLARRLGALVPADSESVVYDCYGDGLYRNALKFRHRHRDALVQIANELAARGLCHPLIPTSHADVKLLMRAFQGRLKQAAAMLRARSSTAVLCIIVDAADNAGIAAEELRDHSFVQDVMSMDLPDEVRLVFTCRSHRQHYLHPTSTAIRVLLEPFSVQETARHLRHYYPDATQQEVDEFGLLSSFNPRVQALALDQRLPLQEMLLKLGPTPTTVDKTISDLLAGAIARLREQGGTIEGAQIDIICRCLAVLRPLIPIPVLAQMAGATEEAVRSFAFDLRRPLLVKGDSLHFLDEPSETWFRDNFRPDAAQMQVLLRRLRPLTATSAYAAAVLPQLLLEAGEFDELVELALSSDNLPTNNPLARRDVDLQRLSFALKACLNTRRYLPAAKLALRAGGEAAAESRQNSLVQQNTDLAAYLLSVDRIEEVVSRRTFASTWMGSSQAYYAGLLAGRPELTTDAASRLRMAIDWLMAWARREKVEHGPTEKDVTDADRAELTLAYLRVRDAPSAADFLRRWTLKSLALTAGRQVSERLLDQHDTNAVDALFLAAENNVWLLLGVALESARVGHLLPAKPLGRLLKLLGSRHVKLEVQDTWSSRGIVLSAVAAAIQIALKVLPLDASRWSRILARYLPDSPPYDLVERHSGVHAPALRAYALHAELSGRPLTIKGLAHKSICDSISPEGKAMNHDSEAESFCRDLGSVLDWFVLGAAATCGLGIANLEAAATEALRKVGHAESHRYFETAALTNDVAIEWFIVLREGKATTGEPWSRYATWLDGMKEKFWPRTLIELCRLAAHVLGLEAFAISTAAYTYRRIEELVDSDADSRVGHYKDLARAILPLSKEEAAAYFDRAIEIASRIGEENVSRWEALVDLAIVAGTSESPSSALAYKFAQGAELTDSYADNHFNWRGTVDGLGRLSAPSLLTISSRWRDRRFGDHDFLLPNTIEKLIELGQLPDKAAVVLGGRDARWDRLAALEVAIEKEVSLEGKRRLLDTAYRYIRVQVNKKSNWQRLKALGERFGVELPDIDRLIQASSNEAENQSPSSLPLLSSKSVQATVEAANEDWKAEFDAAQLDDASSLKDAFERIQRLKQSVAYGDFLGEGLRRTGPGGAAAFLNAVIAWGDLDVYDLRTFLAAVPAEYRLLASVRNAMKAAVLTVCHREPSKIFRRPRWEFLPLQQLANDGIVPDAEVVVAVLSGYVEVIERADASELFHLMDSLAAKLAPVEAAEALDYGLNLLQEALVDEKGDGPWSEALRPPQDVLTALAGYIWAGLGAPIVAERWQFAHIVRNAVEVQWDSLLDELAAHAIRNEGGPYTDHRLDFYSWHARQWLLIGLARGAMSRQGLPASCISLLENELGTRHVLIRAFAAKALTVLGVARTDAEKARLLAINTCSLPEQVTDSYVDDLETEPRDEEPERNDSDFHFGIDIGPYWFAPLGRAFRLSEAAITRRARDVIISNMHVAELSRGTDTRYSRGVFPKHSYDTYHSHGNTPRIDDLLSYRAYHAMMFVAADLLNECATVRGAEDSQNRFEEWLGRHLLTRQSDMWLSDLRDPQLTHVPGLQDGSSANDWHWSVTADYLDSQLRTDDGRHVVWGNWGFGRNGDDEDISVRSVITERALAPALLAALQTAETDRYYLPSADDREVEDDNPLPFVAWVSGAHGDLRLDERDPWSSGMPYPVLRPGERIRQELALQPSVDERRWTAANGGTLRSEAWTRQVGYGREETTISGIRLSADAAFIETLLTSSSNPCLVICVSVRPRLDRYAAQAADLDEFKYLWPYKRYYMLSRDGIIATL